MEPNDFERIVSEHYEALYRFAFSLARQESDAKDLTQQTFYIWARKAHQLRDSSKVKTWLFTTLHRAFLAGWRKNNQFLHQNLDSVSNELPAVFPEPPCDSPQVLRALGQVDERYRAAIALFYLQDYRYKDIAEILGVPVGTVKSRLARGVQELRKILLSDGSVRDPDSMEEDARTSFFQEPVVLCDA
jgi:RNA polymerase sigma-70 factor (ECF subfamily)